MVQAGSPLDWGERILDSLSSGVSAHAVLAPLAGSATADASQVAIIDASGEVAVHSGERPESGSAGLPIPERFVSPLGVGMIREEGPHSVSLVGSRWVGVLLAAVSTRPSVTHSLDRPVIHQVAPVGRDRVSATRSRGRR